MGCLCALTFIAFLGIGDWDIDQIYGKPLHCVQGSFYFNDQDQSFVFIRHFLGEEQRVSIRLPHVGTFSVFYCWGDHTAMLTEDNTGWREVPVVIQVIVTKKGLA